MEDERTPGGEGDGRAQVGAEVIIAIASSADIVTARQRGRALSATLGFSSSELTLIATAISELARNIVQYAQRGEIGLRLVERDGQCGIAIQARDDGPGIADSRRVLQGGYSTSRSLGLGLSGVKRLMDEFELDSKVGHGTMVTAHKWTREYKRS
ncbi:MAG: anti-sigma regulatory factor [Terriglobales bacterium]